MANTSVPLPANCAVLYARVSTDEQASNYSIASQVEAGRRYAAARGLEVVGVFEDVASGSSLGRPRLTELRDLVHTGAINSVIVYALDRLSRTLAHMLLLRDELRSAGVALHFVNKGEAGESPEARLFDQIEGAFAEFERLRIAERSARGHKQKLLEGKLPGSPNLPFGFRYTDETKTAVAIEESEAAVIRMIYEWYATTGAGLHVIINKLDALGILTPADRRHYNVTAKRKKAQGHWTLATVAQMLRDPIYRGEYHIKAGAETVMVPVPPIVDDATWYACKQVREDRKRFAKRNSKRFYLLSGRVRCGVCGSAACGTSSNKPRSYYRCRRAFHSGNGADPVCPTPMVRAEKLDPTVWRWLDECALDEAHIRAAVAARVDGGESEKAKLETERNVYAQQLEQLDAQAARLIQLYTAGMFTIEEISAQKALLDRSKVSVVTELARVDKELATLLTVRDREAAIVLQVRKIRERLTAGVTNETKRRIIDLLDLEVTTVMSEGGIREVDVVARFTEDHARLIIAGLADPTDCIVSTNEKDSIQRQATSSQKRSDMAA